MRRRVAFLLFLFLPLIFFAKELKVGIKYSEPWVMYDKNVSIDKRHPVGFSIDLWKKIASELNVTTKWVYFDTTSQIIQAAHDKKIDAGIAAITITSEREKLIDFSNSMYELGLQVMVDASKSTSSALELMWQEIKKMLTLKSVFYFFFFFLITIHLRWLVDRKRVNSNLFTKDYPNGIIDAFWWGLTMLVTWETPPSKGLARVIDLTWHIVGIIAVSILTAVVTSALTAQAIGGSIHSEKDLIGKYIAAVATDAPRRYLEKIGANVIAVKNIEEGIKLIRKGKAEALVHDGPRLQYIANSINKKAGKKVLLVLPFSFNPQNYGIVFPSKSPLREEVNRILLKLRESNGLEKSFHEQLREKWIKKDK